MKSGGVDFELKGTWAPEVNAVIAVFWGSPNPRVLVKRRVCLVKPLIIVDGPMFRTGEVIFPGGDFKEFLWCRHLNGGFCSGRNCRCTRSLNCCRAA